VGAEGEFSFNLFSVSLSDLERLKDLQRRNFAENRRTVAESTPEETVVLTNVQLLPLTKRRQDSGRRTDRTEDSYFLGSP
jgi:hypothetical protein